VTRQVEIKSTSEIALMREAGRIVREILDALEAMAVAGVTTWELDRVAEDLTRKKGAKPAFKGYLGYPAVLCASVNEEVVHGIPSRKRKLQEGDLLKLDFGVSFKGFFGDSARTVPIGKPSREAQSLSEATRISLEKAIEVVAPGRHVGDIGAAVQGFVESRGYSVVRDFTGHGIGRALHEAPQVPNFGRSGEGTRLLPGMTLAIEPMVNAGTHEVLVLDDDWTAVTRDGKLSAHFEHTVLVTEQGREVLTRA
jgi:methionyl aminopeptidase